MASKWRQIGDHLSVPVDQLDVIQENNRGGVNMAQNCLRDMFIWWLQNKKATTVGKLINAIHAVGRHDIEIEISQKYGKWKITIIYRTLTLWWSLPYLLC